MAAGTVQKQIRKAGAFVGGELAAGQWGLDVTNKVWYFSADGTTVNSVTGSGGGVDTTNSPNANEFARFTDADTIEGRTVAETKSDLSLDNVTNESKATMFTSPAFTGTPTTPTAPGATNTTQVASTAFVQQEIATAVTGLLEFKGTTNCSANPNYPAGVIGDGYVVSAAGKIGGASGKVVEIGDWYICTANNAGGTEASVGTSWTVIQQNLSGVLTSADIGVTVAAQVHTHAAADIVSGNLDTARMQTNVVAAINAGHGTINDSAVIIDGGTI
jgi:hypothetical protein